MTNKLKTFYNIDTTIDTKLVENADIKMSGHGIYTKKKITFN